MPELCLHDIGNRRERKAIMLPTVSSNITRLRLHGKQLYEATTGHKLTLHRGVRELPLPLYTFTCLRDSPLSWLLTR